jgi:hypothetical protein
MSGMGQSTVVLSKEELMNRKATISLEVLVKFDNSMRECPPMMPMESENQSFLLVPAMSKTSARFDFDVMEADPPKDRAKMAQESIKNARKYNYGKVITVLTQKQDPLAIKEFKFGTGCLT